MMIKIDYMNSDYINPPYFSVSLLSFSFYDYFLMNISCLNIMTNFWYLIQVDQAKILIELGIFINYLFLV